MENETDNLESKNEETTEDNSNVEALKEKNVKLGDLNRQLFERSKKA